VVRLKFQRGKALQRPVLDKRQVHGEGSELWCFWAVDLMLKGGGGGWGGHAQRLLFEAGEKWRGGRGGGIRHGQAAAVVWGWGWGASRWQDLAAMTPGRAMRAHDSGRLPVGRPRERRESGPRERKYAQPKRIVLILIKFIFSYKHD
jgi:hypothetical protein